MTPVEAMRTCGADSRGVGVSHGDNAHFEVRCWSATAQLSEPTKIWPFPRDSLGQEHDPEM